MRFIVLGAGAVGGCVGARLAQQDEQVLLVARGAHYEAIRDRGLRLESPVESVTLSIPVVDHVSKITWQPDDLVLLATKTQDSAAALDALRRVAPRNLPVLCVQNTVANEPMARALFDDVYGVFVWSPSDHLQPGVVRVWCAPKSGILHIGRYPAGVDDLASSVAARFRNASFFSEPKADVMRWKYRKLLSNLGNAVEALCGPEARGSGLARRAREEALACFDAEGISFVADDEQHAAELERQVQAQLIDGIARKGGSTWQSLERRLGSVETDYLNGEIVRMGQRNGIATPVNAMLLELTHKMSAEHRPPGSLTPAEIIARLKEGGETL